MASINLTSKPKQSQSTLNTIIPMGKRHLLDKLHNKF